MSKATMAGAERKSRHGRVRYPRRAVLLAITGGGVISAGATDRLVRTAAARQDDATPAAVASPAATPIPFTAQVFTGAGFVGEAQNVPSREAFVAIVVADAQPGTEARDVRTLLYGDDQNQIQEWFIGTVSGDHLDLVSETGAQLRGQFGAEGASGTIPLTDGTSLPYELVPTTGVAGLYTVILFPDGRVEGTSERGARLEAQVQGDDPLTGTIAPPDGAAQPFAAEFRLIPQPEAVNLRFIILADGRIKGGAKRDEDTKVAISATAR